MKILICAVGSGGHIYPALSLARELKRELAPGEIILVTTKKGIEQKILKGVGFEVVTIDFVSRPSKHKANPLIFLLKYLYFLLKFTIESIKVFILLFKIKADVIIGFGGVNSFSLITAGALLGIPTLVHEQNIVPGLANRLLAKISRKVAISFKQTNTYFKRKDVICTGNPIRSNLKRMGSDVARRSLEIDEHKFSILVFGGSQGSSFINQIAIELAKSFSDKQKEKLQVIHITGDKDKQDVLQSYTRFNVRSKVIAYLQDMNLAYSAADLVICRAGASTLSEINYFGLGAILIPYPYAYGHQLINAKFMQDQGAAFVIEQDDNCLANLKELTNRILQDDLLLAKMAKASQNLSNNKASEKLAELVRNLVKDRV